MASTAFSWKQLSLMALILPVFGVFKNVKQKSQIVKKQKDDSKFITKSFFNGLDTFLAQLFFELAFCAYFLFFR